jgi:hypothetical protein
VNATSRVSVPAASPMLCSASDSSATDPDTATMANCSSAVAPSASVETLTARSARRLVTTSLSTTL